MNLAIASHLASSTAAATTAVNMKRQEKMWSNEISWHSNITKIQTTKRQNSE